MYALTNAAENLKRHYSAPLKKDKKFFKICGKTVDKTNGKQYNNIEHLNKRSNERGLNGKYGAKRQNSCRNPPDAAR